MGKQKERENLEELSSALAERFDRWDYILEHGTQDPTWPDGTNINLVRNHIINCKKRIEEYVHSDQNEMNLFSASFPEIYYRETPPKLPDDFMAREEEIRARAKEQLALYEKDSNFCYLRDHYDELIERWQNRSARVAGMYPGKYCVSRYIKSVEEDNLVSMRCFFRTSYEEMSALWATAASELQQYFQIFSERNLADEGFDVVDDDDEEYEEFDSEVESDLDPDSVIDDLSKKESLDHQIKSAEKVNSFRTKPIEAKNEQLSLF